MRKKWIFSILLTVMMCLALLPNTVVSAAGGVAQIGDTTYATLDEAVTAAADGDTIIVLQDCETSGLNLSKDLTIKGADGVNPTITFNTYGIALWGKALTFENCVVQMNNITSTPYTGEWNWMAICASTNASLTLNNVTMNIVADSTSTNNAHCIYFCNNNKLNLNDSTLYIANYKQDALEWDGGDGGYNINFANSTFISDNNRSGFTGTFYVTIADSDVQVINSLGNGSNGSHFIITNSTVDFSDNVSHGLSTGILTVTDSTITANNNGLTGIIFNNKATFENSNVTITGTRGTSYWNAGMRALGSSASCTIDADCTFKITNNYVTGIFLDADTSLTVAEGANVVVTGNEAMQVNCSTNKELAKSGGGILIRSGATAKLSSTTQIYNNHAALAGDDIYLEGAGSSITFYDTVDTWYLNASYLDGSTHCNHFIDGWYNDGYTDGETSDRWEADAENEEYNYVSLYEVDGSATVTLESGVLALKAAHGYDPKTPESKITIPDLDKTIVTEEGETDRVSVNAGETVTFQLESTVPNSDKIKDSISYAAGEGSDETWVIPIGSVVTDENGETATYTITFHDVMDSSLILNANSIKVSVQKWVVTLDEETGLYSTTGKTELVDVTEYATRVTTDLDDGCTFEVSIDLLALYADGVITEEDFGWASVYVTYEATLSEDAAAGAYYNTAWVVSPDGETEHDKVEVDTYGIKIFKYDQTDSETDDEGNVTYAGLPGATFELYMKKADVTTDEPVDSDDTENPSGESSNSDSDEGISTLSEEEEEITIKDLTAENGDYVYVATLVSGADGYVTLEGLAGGTYYLVETEAPSGYVKADTVLTIIIPDRVNEDSESENYYLAYVEFANAPIPETGGMGTTIFKITGMSLLLAAGVVFFLSNRRKREEV